MNGEDVEVRLSGDFSNEGIMKQVKENIGEMQGFVDILSMYQNK